MQNQIKAGDVVRLKSEKTKSFTVGDVTGDNIIAECYHFDPVNNIIVISKIPVVALTKTTAN